MNIKKVFADFCDELESRCEIMTEDNIRYYWFSAMTVQDKNLNNYTLEYPYNLLANNGLKNNIELDLLYNNSDEKMCLEVKFHRTPTSTQLAKTEAAGEIFDDLQRLQVIKQSQRSTRCLLLYITDCKMHDYFCNKKSVNTKYRKQLRKFFEEKKNGDKFSVEFSKAKKIPSTFINKAYNSFPSIKTQSPPLRIANLQLLFRNDLKCQSSSFTTDDCYVRLYELI